MKKLLITGGAGLLGGYLVKNSVGKWDVYATYHKHKFDFPDVKWVYMDLIGDIDEEFKNLKPDVVIHTAGLTKPDKCEKNKSKSKEINVGGTERIIEMFEKFNSRMIYVSTDMVFNGEKGMYSEEDNPSPINYYGETKYKSEILVKENCKNYLIVRSAIIYGQTIVGTPSFSDWILEKIANNDEVMLFHDQFRTPIMVVNLAEALLELAEKDFDGVIHLGGSERLNRYSFGIKLARNYNLDEKLIKSCSMYDVEPVAPRPRDLSLNINLAKKILNTKLLNCDEGIQLMKKLGMS